MPRRRLLVIPHQFGEGIRIRGIELAKHLVPHFDVYCFTWSDLVYPAASAWGGSRAGKLARGWGTAVRRIVIEKGADGVTYVRAPILQVTLLHRVLGVRGAYALIRRINRILLEKLLKQLRIDLLLVGNAFYHMPRTGNAKVFFDFPDLYDEPGYIRHVRDHTAGCVVVSQPLQEKLRREYGMETMYLPNGADLKFIRSGWKRRSGALRRELGLQGKFVIGSIGNHGDLSGLDFLVESFQSLRKRMPDAALLVVGPADHWQGRLDLRSRDGIRFVGKVPPDKVPAYLHALDVGVVAKKKTPDTDMAFHIKAVEYSACRKIIVSTPLSAIEGLGWPHVLLTDLRVEDWVAAVGRAREMKWRPRWDSLIEPYDWSRIAGRLAGWMRT